jgi:hypothetical protein
MRKQPRSWRFWIVVLFAFVFSVWALSGLVISKLPGLVGWLDRGAFGDMFGVVGALFSGLAFAGIIVTVRLQSRELQQQRESIRQSNRNLTLLASAQHATELSMWRLTRTQAVAGLALIHTSQQLRTDVLKPDEDRLNAEIVEADKTIRDLELTIKQQWPFGIEGWLDHE